MHFRSILRKPKTMAGNTNRTRSTPVIMKWRAARRLPLHNVDSLVSKNTILRVLFIIIIIIITIIFVI